MKTNTHNALHVKRKIRPRDYRRDQNIVIVNPKTGKAHTIPTCIILALRSGQITVQ